MSTVDRLGGFQLGQWRELILFFLSFFFYFSYCFGLGFAFLPHKVYFSYSFEAVERTAD